MGILADIGLPMVAVYLPWAWLGLVPIILIEAGFGTWRYQLSFGRACAAQATANCLSTLIGIPITWLALVFIQFFTTSSGAGPAWLLPEPTSANVAVAVILLTVVFYFMSVISERGVVGWFYRELPRRTLWGWELQGNAITYALLTALIFTAHLAPKASQRVVETSQPVVETIVDFAFFGAQVMTGSREKEPPLIDAVNAGDLKKAEKLIRKGADPNQTNDVGFPALSIAAGRGDEKMTRLLLAAGANVNPKSSDGDASPLASAAQRGNAATVRVLLQAGANVNAKDGAEWTPLFNAALSGDLETLDVLISAGADVNARSDTGWTALKEAQSRGDERTVERLKRAGAVDFPDGSRQ